MRQKTIDLKLAMTADLTGVPRAQLSEEREMAIQAARTLLVNRLLASSDTVSNVKKRHDSRFKYDRLIGIDRDGQMVMVPVSYSDNDIFHVILLSDLRSDKFLFYACSGPVAQTGENKVRSLFVPTASMGGHGFPPDCEIVKDEIYVAMADITGEVRVKCSYIQSYYGRLSNAYITSTFVEGEIDESYCLRVLAGESVYESEEEVRNPENAAMAMNAAIKAREKYTTPDGKKPTTYEEAIAHIWS